MFRQPAYSLRIRWWIKIAVGASVAEGLAAVNEAFALCPNVFILGVLMPG
jgi:hypothetical protein